MFISKVYVRFYKSFNFDYLRKAHANAQPDPWDMTSDGQFYPFVQVDLESGITTVVGANESGKSHLLSAIKCALTGTGIKRGDFCRYSQFFVVNRSMVYPDLGLEFQHLTDHDRSILSETCNTAIDQNVDSFTIFRICNGAPQVYIRGSEGWQPYTQVDQSALGRLLPKPFEIDAEVPLPDSVPIAFLAKGMRETKARSRSGRLKALTALMNDESWFESVEQIRAAAPQIFEAISSTEPRDSRQARAMQRLADDLLVKVAGIDRSAFSELLEAIEGGAEGYANGIVERINHGLRRALNFPKWWSQDQDFELLITLRDQDLVFTIRDRTGTEYSFGERSVGLKFFLSYFVQYLSHEPPGDGAIEILLMDEPDAYLSSMGQQDLLRIFEGFAYPEEDRPACQVVYVTHSPFLIDKNHGERLRVLEKGEGDEGTRVVRNAAKNHYEPLRSALGSFAGETTFISNCNLMLEGMSDQVLLAGMATRLRREGAPMIENLNLNTITLVPAGSASQIPYLVYLARGRDVDRPAVVVLLDGDSAGNDARRALQRGGPRNKQILDQAFVLQLSDSELSTIVSSNPTGTKEIEDLIPLEISLTAACRYVAEFIGPEEAKRASELRPEDVDFSGGAGSHSAIEHALKTALGEQFHLDKLGFARSVIDVISGEASSLSEPLKTMDENFRLLFRALGRRQRNASRDAAREKMDAKIKRVKGSFLQDHPEGATREQVLLLLEEIEANLDGSVFTEEFRSRIRKLRYKYELDSELTRPIANFDELRGDLEALTYLETHQSQEPTSPSPAQSASEPPLTSSGDAMPEPEGPSTNELPVKA